MKIQGTADNGLVVAAVEGRMDAASTGEFDRAAETWLGAEATTFILDFSGLDYISSAGLRSLLVLGKKAAARNGRVVLAAVRETVREIFAISGFDKLFAVEKSVEDALRRVR